MPPKSGTRGRSAWEADPGPGLTLQDLEDRQLKSHWDYLSLFKKDQEPSDDDEISLNSDSAIDYGYEEARLYKWDT